MKEDLLHKALSEIGRKGGKRRLETMTKDQRAEIARAAGKQSGVIRAAAAAEKKTPGRKAGARRRTAA